MSMMFQYGVHTSHQKDSMIAYPPPMPGGMLHGHPRPFSAPCSLPVGTALGFTPLGNCDAEAMSMPWLPFGSSQDAPSGCVPRMSLVNWDLVVDPNQVLWIPDAAASAGACSGTTAPPSPPMQSHRHRTNCPRAAAARHERRRALQKGYEQQYRQRKREDREDRRLEWLSLEYQLKHELRAAQNSVVFRSYATMPSATMELCAECVALRTERAILECMLVTEQRLHDAREFFTQPQMREQLNALANTPSVMKFQFTW